MYESMCSYIAVLNQIKVGHFPLYLLYIINFPMAKRSPSWAQHELIRRIASCFQLSVLEIRIPNGLEFQDLQFIVNFVHG